MTRVLQVIDGLRIGGAETVLLGLLELTDHDRFPTDDAFVERVAAASRGVFVVTGRGLWDPRPVARLVSIIRRERIDLVQTHLAGADFQGGLAARLTGRPAVAVLHSVAGDRAGYRRSRRVLADFATRHLRPDRGGERRREAESRLRARSRTGARDRAPERAGRGVRARRGLRPHEEAPRARSRRRARRERRVSSRAPEGSRDLPPSPSGGRQEPST